ncbi:VWA domain-containing protein [Edaphobacillus lindanitolerans]|uniref:Nitric oxide reductase activation protein n=1 Tax=Edaphobacillus lindanitolerans TaxID=550447 RepID=A0A1U7PPQ9_9BACI|nr:VWA domain-containing protein [Edaphobacillus lindanitolerans]SIT80787.1 Nitric oxide reductase activation protein [Edaphobacillus lindanitolerans]
MTAMKRFIDFNDERVDADERLRHERLARALAGEPELRLTERKLLEYNLPDHEMAMSVFWRHRSAEIREAGRLSDIYLLAAGFWTGFDLAAWRDFAGRSANHPLRNLLRQTVLLIEEMRLSDAVMKERPGTKEAFNIRREVYAGQHGAQLPINLRHGHPSDALFNHFHLVLNGAGDDSLGEISALADPVLFLGFDSRSTRDSIRVVERLAPILEEHLDQDLIRTYYAIADSFTSTRSGFHYHKGVKTAEAGEEGEKDTIQEVFRTWHGASQSEKGPHLDYELEHGRIGKSDAGSSREGRAGMDVQSFGRGRSVADEQTGRGQSGTGSGEAGPGEWRQAKGFGSENTGVVFRERVAEPDREGDAGQKTDEWRSESAPYVRAIEREMKKRIERKREDRRDGLPMGRLSGNPVDILLSERPKPFYRKQRPSERLDAVFGLLVDGSGSMADKLQETKKAVLLFHDVLTALAVKHGIVSYQEDAGLATKERQPNEFLWLHRFADTGKDDSGRILAWEAGDDNRDGFAIRWMTRQLGRMQEQHKFLLIFTDGEPSAFGYGQNGIVDTAEAVNEAEKKGITIIHLFLSAQPVDERQQELFRMMYGNRTASAESLSRFSDETIRILRKLLALVASAD